MSKYEHLKIIETTVCRVFIQKIKMKALIHRVKTIYIKLKN